MADHRALPLVLGGHSPIQQLGNEPMLNRDEQAALVAANVVSVRKGALSIDERTWLLRLANH